MPGRREAPLAKCKYGLRPWPGHDENEEMVADPTGSAMPAHVWHGRHRATFSSA